MTLSRRTALYATVLLALPVPLWADTLSAQAPVRAVTLFPQGARISRAARISAPAGRHQLVITGLPAGIDPDTLRVSAEDLRVGSIALQTGRALPDSLDKAPRVVEAEAEVRRLEAALRDRDARVAAIRARAQAAEDTVAFLRALGTADGAASGDVAALTATVADRLQAARHDAVVAEAEARTADVGRDDDVKALEAARATLDALRAPDAARAALVLDVETTGAPGTISITSFTDDAGWRPVYDLRLDTFQKRLTMDRGVIITQHSGEDWADVALTMSTARPSDRIAPARLDPWFPHVGDQPDPRRRSYDMEAADMAGNLMSRAAPAPLAEAAQTGRIGATVVYTYAGPVTIRDGVDALRLALDSRDLTPDQVVAQAVPALDDTAYLLARLTNALDEPILPGRAALYADGAMVGETDLDLIAAGDDIELGFGAIDGLRLERRLPDQSEGERGIISTRSARHETALLRIENVTNRAWPLRVIDRVPVSTQDDLKIDWTADPRPTEVDPDGKRGILVWMTDVAAHDVREITVTTDMRWPSGKVLLP